jgi:hypothetical protein
MRCLFLALLLTGCEMVSTKETPREWECNTTCEECGRVETTCHMTGQGRTDNTTTIEKPGVAK